MKALEPAGSHTQHRATPRVCVQIARLEGKTERLQASLSELSQDVLDSKARELTALSKVETLEREMEVLRLRSAAWLEQIDEEKAGVVAPPPGSRSGELHPR